MVWSADRGQNRAARDECSGAGVEATTSQFAGVPNAAPTQAAPRPSPQIWGVIIFLRLGWLVGYGGIGLIIAVVLLSSAITTLTTLSLSAISTNGRVQGGGAYFLISRSLGPELGGAIGVLFAAANAVAIALYLLGLAETVVDQVGVPIIDRDWDLRIIAFICLAVLTILVFVGISVVIKFQLALLLLLLLAFASFIAGVFLDPNRPGADPAALVIGSRNWLPAFDGQAAEYPEAAAKLLTVDGTVTFATCLAIFFPAATGEHTRCHCLLQALICHIS